MNPALSSQHKHYNCLHNQTQQQYCHCYFTEPQRTILPQLHLQTTINHYYSFTIPQHHNHHYSTTRSPQHHNHHYSTTRPPHHHTRQCWSYTTTLTPPSRPDTPYTRKLVISFARRKRLHRFNYC